MLESESELLLAIQAASKSLSKALNGYKSLARALEKIDSNKALERQDYVADAVDALKNNDLRAIGCDAPQEDIQTALEDKLRILRANAHHDLMTGLARGLQDKPEHLKVLSDSPLVVYLHPLTLEVQFEQKKAIFAYAHEPLATTSLDPDEILKTRTELLEVFRASRIESTKFWDICKLAYEMVVLKNGQPVGSRVDIVELLPPLAWLWPNPAVVKKSSGFPKYLLAYQIQKLRADKLLQNKNARIDLGTATGGSTKNKANVLYIPMGATEGQYYLSICFRQA